MELFKKEFQSIYLFLSFQHYFDTAVQNKTIRFAVVNHEPFLSIETNETTGEKEYEGFWYDLNRKQVFFKILLSFDLLQELQKLLGFKYELISVENAESFGQV